MLVYLIDMEALAGPASSSNAARILKWRFCDLRSVKPLFIQCSFMLLFDDNKIQMARKPGKKQKENPVEFTGEDEKWKGNTIEGKTGTVLELNLEVS